MCTSDFMVYIIGKKCDLQVLLNENSIWSEVYTINTELNGYLITGKNVLY
jgi:CHASE3 domain sensor protein